MTKFGRQGVAKSWLRSACYWPGKCAVGAWTIRTEGMLANRQTSLACALSRREILRANTRPRWALARWTPQRTRWGIRTHGRINNQPWCVQKKRRSQKERQLQHNEGKCRKYKGRRLQLTSFSCVMHVAQLQNSSVGKSFSAKVPFLNIRRCVVCLERICATFLRVSLLK